ELPEDNAVALDYLATWISSEMPGSLLANLRAESFCNGLKWRETYRYANQAVVVLTLPLTERGRAQPQEIISRVLGWLTFFARAGIQRQFREAFRYSRLRSLQGFTRLEQLRYWAEPAAWSAANDSDSLHRAFGAVMRGVSACEPIVL